MALTPVIFVSHGSPLMSSRESECSKAWAQFGKDALKDGIKGVVFVGAHWEELNSRIRVASKTDPRYLQMDMVPEERWKEYQMNISPLLARRVVEALKAKGFPDVDEDPGFDLHDDILIPALWMFEKAAPPSTIVSMNAKYDASFHIQLGKALSELRREGILIICTGGAVHNLYRNNWMRLILGGMDNFQVDSKPASWAAEFAQAVGDVVANNKGDDLAGALTRLTHSPLYKSAHPSDDHYYPILVAAGLVAESAEQGRHIGRTWELKNMCNDQFVWGQWHSEAKIEIPVA